MRILALSFDLDDTLWPVGPVIGRAEQALDAWLRANCPAVAAQYPIPAMRALRERVAVEHAHLAHDFTAQRKLALRIALEPHGFGDDHVDAGFAEFYTARNTVEFYDDTLPALRRLAAHFPMISLSNGTADLDRIGLRHWFAHSISARTEGVAKPAAAIFGVACARLGVAPENVLHVGDDAALDVLGAHAAGLRTAWVNRHGLEWTESVRPDLVVTSLEQLADQLVPRITA